MIGRLSRYASALVVFVGIAVVVSWVCDFERGKSLVGGQVTMKFWTALCFILTGSVWFLLDMNGRERAWREFAASMICMATFSVTMALLLAHLSGQATPLAVFSNADTAIKTKTAGMPSFCTMINFLVCNIAAFLHIGRKRRSVFWCGVICLASGLIAMLGYLVNFSFLYCYMSDKASSAMAVHTASCFALLGVSMIWTTQAAMVGDSTK